MVNTRKENRIKKTKKRFSKKMYGGNSLSNQISNKVLPDYNSLQNQYANKLTNSLPNYSSIQKIPSGQITDGKNVFSNFLSIGAQLANKGINYGLESIAKFTGTDPNLSVDESVNSLKNKAQNIANVISNTELGNELAEQLGTATSKILGPALEKGSDIINELAKKEEKAVVGLGANLAEDVAYPIVAPIRTALSGLQVVENATEAAAEATGVLKEQVEAYNEVKDKIGETIEEITDIASKNILPSEISNELSNQISNQISKEISNPINNLQPDKLTNPEESLKKINKEGIMVGGRIINSQMDFLKPFTNSSKIIKSMNSWKTKKQKIQKRKRSYRIK
jgi:hypothetical protein